MNCIGCLFWDHLEDISEPGAKLGLCRRRSPHPLVEPCDELSMWPITKASDWCGEGMQKSGMMTLTGD